VKIDKLNNSRQETDRPNGEGAGNEKEFDIN
jgi:hypothetical protein